jgi:hypothetical protein
VIIKVTTMYYHDPIGAYNISWQCYCYHFYSLTFSGAFEGVVGLAAYGAIVLVLWFGGKLVFEQSITPGVLFCK